MKKLLLLLVLAVAVYANYARQGSATSAQDRPESSPQGQLGSEASDSEVQGTGVVVRVLADDRDGSPHQRFLLRLASGQTVLIAHNIDLAPRIAGLREGDTVQYKGEFIWNPKGGVIHWTHRDPSGRHPDGWLKHNGQLSQ
jgi:hypothetical protein